MTVSIMQELIALLKGFKPTDYAMPLAVLSGATIGEHTRHTIEMYQCLINGYEKGEVNYEKRKRDPRIEQSLSAAIECMENIILQCNGDDKPMLLCTEEQLIKTSFNREILYCNEHAIHHMALLKVGLMQFEEYRVHENFGVAPSTIKNRESCAL
jgi:hypothetical protein